MRVDPRDDGLHDEVFGRAGPLALRSLAPRTGGQAAGRHHGDERPHVAITHELVGDVLEMKRQDERGGLAPEPVQQIQDRITLHGIVVRRQVDQGVPPLAGDERVRYPPAPHGPAREALDDGREAGERRFGRRRRSCGDGKRRDRSRRSARQRAPHRHFVVLLERRLSAG